jgi:hypothetical protein
MARRSYGRLACALALSLASAVGACRSRVVPAAAPAPAATEAEVDEFRDLVEDLTRIGSHGAIDPKRDREGGR